MLRYFSTQNGKTQIGNPVINSIDIMPLLKKNSGPPLNIVMYPLPYDFSTQSLIRKFWLLAILGGNFGY